LSEFVVRGRIREADQVRRRFGAPLPAEIAYDEFSTDIAENRILARRGGTPPTRARRARSRALRLAGLGLDNASVAHLPCGVRMNGFLFDMNTVFEDFVCAGLPEALSVYGGARRAAGQECLPG
jgi:5-methylcytosine-specific restriction enzyme subunit McrC